MRNDRLERLDDMEFGGSDRTIPRVRASGPGHASARARAPRIEWIVTKHGDPQAALRILAEPALIDAAFSADLPGWGGFDPVVQDILLGRR